jgi:glycosyltransferase involved in cell wall biosynthesis
MKRVLYVSFLDEGKLSGYKYKIHSQCQAINRLGYETYLLIINKGEILLYKISEDSQEIMDRVKPNKKRIFSRRNIIDEFFLFKEFTKRIIQTATSYKPNYIYFRRILPITPLLLKTIKTLKDNSISVYYEYPTFPWEKELLKEKKYLFYLIDKLLYKKLLNLVDKLVIVGANESEYDGKYIVISNSIKVKDIPIAKSLRSNEELNLIGVANVNTFHGYDRIIRGLKNYYSKEQELRVLFHIVGNISRGLKLKELVNSLNLQDSVIFHGHKEGEELNRLFDKSQLGVGCLGVHRKNVRNLNSLKNREYTARGLPFVYSENDLALEKNNPEFIYKPSFDDSDINIEKIVDFYKNLNVSSSQIRKFAEKHLDWETQMVKVFNKTEGEV